MASIKRINDLTEITSANKSDYLIINQNGNTRKITVENIKSTRLPPLRAKARANLSKGF